MFINYIKQNKYKISAFTLSTSTLLLYNKYYRNKYQNKFTYKEVELHNNIKNGVWVTYNKNVYDITEFIKIHPGGEDKIMLAAGKSIEPFWDKYKQHINDKNIYKYILSPMKIGELIDYDENKIQTTNHYLNDPVRSNLLKFHSYQPCNAETPIEYMTEQWITPNDDWYVRNHHPVPKINANEYRLYINNISITLEQLKKKFKKVSVISTIQCGGNRRSEYNKKRQTSGTPWNIGAISNAKWTGISLRQFLEYYKIDSDINYIEFESYDGLKVSIPIEKAMNPYGDVILAYEMNDEEIPPDHGYPLRAIVPGYVGIKNVKWLKSINPRKDESEGSWQRGLAYKRLPPSIINPKNTDLSLIPTTNELPVQSFIVSIKDNKIYGIAYSGGGRAIIRVEVSEDNGISWKIAKLKQGSEQNKQRAWAWTFWETYVDNNSNKFICRATDSSYNVQPNSIDDIWNVRGLNNNSWHIINN